MTDAAHYPISRARPGLLEPRKPGEHVWILAAIHRVSADEIGGWRGDSPLFLDAENLASAELGCYICEQEWTAEIALKPCPGEPG